MSSQTTQTYQAFVSEAASLESRSYEDLKNTEMNSTHLTQLNTNTAWSLGLFSRNQALERFPDSSITIDITSSAGQCLFRTVTGSGSAPDNDHWIRRKQNSARRFGDSSFLMGKIARAKQQSLSEFKAVDHKDFASHGGSIPLRLVNSDLVVAMFTISGLKQDQDHLFALQLIQQFEKQQQNATI